MKRRRAPRGGGRPCTDQLEVFRVAEGFTWHVWLLAYNPCGLYTHWIKDKSRYCDPRGCRFNCDREEKFWKSYAPTLVFEPDRELWIPAVLEISERLELDFRGHAQRGQVWSVSRAPQSGESHTPVRGQLQEERKPSCTPPAFDHLPILCALYHSDAISLTKACPLPDKFRVEACNGERPKALKTAEEEREAKLKQVAEAASHAPERNGHRPSTVRYY